MRKIFQVDGGVYRILSRVFDLMCLNILVILFSLPLVTIGGSISAALRILFDYEESKDAPLLRTFFQYFKQYLYVSSLALLTEVGVVFLLVSGIFFTRGTAFQFVFLMILAFSLVVFINFLATATYHAGHFKQIFAISIVLTMRYLGIFCLGLGLLILTFLIPIFLPKLMFLWFFLGFSLPLFGNVKLYCWCYSRTASRLKGEHL